MEEYLSKKKSDRIIIFVAAIIFGICGVVLILQDNITIISIGLLVCCLVLFYESFFGKSKENKYFEELKQSGLYNEIANDFVISTSLLNDKIRCGSKYVFREKYAKVITYEEIISLSYYENVQSSDGSIDRGINVELAKHRIEPLCFIDEKDTFADIKNVFDVFAMKNPNIKINSGDFNYY